MNNTFEPIYCCAGIILALAPVYVLAIAALIRSAQIARRDGER